MKSLTQSEIKVLVNFYSHRQIRFILGRQRLRFSIDEIVFYLWCIVEHTNGKRFKYIHQISNPYGVEYNTFMQNIALMSKFMPRLFQDINKLLEIKSSSLLNIVDTSLLAVKKEKYINSNDYKSNKVTSRTATRVDTKGNLVSVKEKVCGFKGLFFINKKKQIYKSTLLNINTSDQNILKDSALYVIGLKGFLLADKGFNCSKVKQRIYSTTAGKAEIVSPRKKNSNKNSNNIIYPFDSIKHQKLYRKRWVIETVLGKLKDPYNDFKLNLSGVKSKNIITAKFFTSLIKYNLSMQ